MNLKSSRFTEIKHLFIKLRDQINELDDTLSCIILMNLIAFAITAYSEYSCAVPAIHYSGVQMLNIKSSFQLIILKYNQIYKKRKF